MSPRNKRVTAEDYIRWLEAQLRDEHSNWDHSYEGVTITMFNKPFVQIIAMDDNRMADGMDLRVDYARLEHIRPTLMPNLGPCSFLEVLIALSRRLAFIGGGQAPGWAWHLMTNLELDLMVDPLTRSKERKVQRIMDTVINRTYSPDGTGGFFPLVRAEDDQTQVEIWYQMNTYIQELHSER